MRKKFLFLFVVFQLIILNNFALSEIIPLKKPSQTKEETKKKLLIDVLKPLPKPIKNIKTETKKVNTEKKVVLKEEKKRKFILPKKKPLVAGSKKTADVKISKYYSKKDFNLANKAISEIKKANWSSALEISKKAKDKSIYNFIQWRHLLRKGNQASYYD